MSRTLSELIDRNEPAWPLVQSWIAEARNAVEVVPTSRARGEDALLRLQVTSRSPMGALALETGGLLVDHRWVRVLGAGGNGMAGSLVTWNRLDREPATTLVPKAVIVGHDVLGGFFGLNGGAWSGQPGNVFYFGPDTLDWEDLEMGYATWLHWLCQGDVAKFYAPNRWPGWESDVSALSPDDGISVYPFLWAEGGPIGERSRGTVPISELWHLHQESARQLRALPEDAQVRIEFTEG
jgi:hypothetical protein